MADELSRRLYAALERRGHGRRNTTANVDIPADLREGFRTRVPDLVVYERRPAKRFVAGEPPEIAVEILSTPRGNIERTEKLDDYARAGNPEYWIVDPFEHAIEIYRLNGNRYDLVELAVEEINSIAMPGLRIDLRWLFDTI